MELTHWPLPSKTYIMAVRYWNINIGSYLMEPTPLNLPNRTYTIEVTSWNLKKWKVTHESYISDVT